MGVRRKKAGITVFQRQYKARDGTTRRCSTWTARVSVHGVTHEKALKTRERRVAEIQAAEWARALEFKAAGLDTHYEARGERVEDLVDEYVGELERQGCSPGHVRPLKARLLRMLERGRTEAGAVYYARSLSEVTPAFVRDALARLERELRKRDGEPVSAQTINKHWGALHAFFEWLIEDERWSTNPCRKKQRKRETDPTFERRALSRDEFARLLEVAPPARRVAYLAAATTGFRRRELHALTWGRVDLEAGEILLTGAQAKNRKRAVQPIPAATVAALKQLREEQELSAGPYPLEHVERIVALAAEGLTKFAIQRRLEEEGVRTPRGVFYSWPAIRKVLERRERGRVPVAANARVFRRLHEVKELKEDLARAGIPYETSRGRVDFHAIRKTYSTALKDVGVTPELRRHLSRHASFELTDKTYTTRWDEELREAVDRLDSWLAVTDTARTSPGPTRDTHASTDEVNSSGLASSGSDSRSPNRLRTRDSGRAAKRTSGAG